jgi:glutamate--cysteine ligase
MAQTAPPITLHEVLHSYEAYHAPRERWLVGGEYERAVVRANGAAIGYHEADGIHWLLDGLAERTAWKPVFEGEYPIALEGEGASITLEPGGQVELSGAPFRRLRDLDAEVRRNRDHLHALAAGRDQHWISCGLTPYAPIASIPFVPKGRYAVMQEYLPSRGDLSHWMMKGTCCVQANYDFSDEEDCARKFRVCLGLSPLNTAIFANSPLAEGKDTGYASYRGHIWTRTDPARTGFPPSVVHGYTHERWIEWLLDRPMMFVYRDGRYIPANGLSFRHWMTHGIEGTFPTAKDWTLHQTSVFPEVRVKRTIEIRGADAVNLELAVAFCAFWAGILYGPQALTDALTLTDAFTATAETHEERHRASAQSGLRATMAGRPAAEWARELGRIAVLGLTEIGEDVSLLDPLLARLEAGRSPSEDVREAFARDPSPANVLPVVAY